MAEVDLKYLAKVLNLSVSTVSRAINNCSDVNEDTRKRVLELSRRLNYQPNAFGKILKYESSKTIGVIIPDIENSFFLAAISGIENTAGQRGYHILVYLSHDSVEKEVEITRRLLNGQVDGVLMSLSKHTTDISHLNTLYSRTPLVLFDRVSERSKACKVVTNNYESSYQAATHLLLKGCRHILYLSSSENLSTDKLRKEGLLQGISSSPDCICTSVVADRESSAENALLIQSALLVENAPDAVFTSAEHLALLCYEVCRKMNLRIPEDVKLISFSNSKFACLYDPALTTLAQPAFEMGEEAARLLLALLSPGGLVGEEHTICLPTVLTTRKSTGD